MSVCWFLVGMVAAAWLPLTATGQGKDLTLSDTSIRVRFSPSTGQVLGLDGADGSPWLAGNSDRYNLESKHSTEAKDEVLRVQEAPGFVEFHCRNADLGVKVVKRYRLDAGILTKESAYSRQDKPLLLRVASETRLDPSAYAEGCYFTNIDDGYKVRAIPFLPTRDMTIASAWNVSTGSLNFYVPKRNALVVHHRHRLNGRCFYGEADQEIESRYLPGGAITALGQDFVGDGQTMRLESRFLVLRGDARKYYEYLVATPPYSDYRQPKLPAWFSSARMWLSDGRSGIGRGLLEDREAVARDLRPALARLRQDEFLMVFFNHWTTSGDLPYRGRLRYGTYDEKGWSDPVPVERFRDAVGWLKSIDPRIKVGGYVYLAPADCTAPYQKHEWLMHAKDGSRLPGGDGISEAAVPDITSGYRAYVLDQLQHMITEYGFDWVHMDTGIPEGVNWRTRRAVQSADWAEFYSELSQFLAKHDAVLVQNVAYAAGLWSHGSYLECQQADRWERKDWRVLGVGAYFAALQRANRPGTWWNLCYGTSDDYGQRNLLSGMRGWTRGWLTWWRNYPQSLACEDIIDELLEASAVGIDFAPNWWRLETDRLELLPMARQRELVLSVLLHADASARETFTLDLAPMAYRPGQLLFAYDLRAMPVHGIDIYRAAPMREPWIEITGLRVEKLENNKHTHAMQLEGRRNYYHVLSQVPAFVSRAGGKQTSLPLADNRGVAIRGSLAPEAKDYTLSVSAASPAAIMAYVPEAWEGAAVTLGGQPVKSRLVELSGRRYAEIEVPAGESRVTLQAGAKAAAQPYQNPMLETWKLAATRIPHGNCELRAFEQDGMACLGITSRGGAAGYVQLPVYPAVPADGVALKLLGRGSGGKWQVALAAGALRTAELVDDFSGWREFTFQAEQMKGAGPWKRLSMIQVQVFPKAGQEMVIAGVRALPIAAEKEERIERKRIVAARTAAPPVLDGQPAERCWKQARAASGFYRLGSAREAVAASQVRACYDQEHLYLFMEAAESIESLGLPGARDSHVENTDHLELYLDPSGDGQRWFHLLVDPAGTIQDWRCDRKSRDVLWNGDYQVKTSLNWKAGWTAEWKIPFATLGKTPKDGDVWGINFARRDIAGELSNWNATGEWLDPKSFGLIEFSPDGLPRASTEVAADALLFRCGFQGSLVPEVCRGERPSRLPEGAEYRDTPRGKALVLSHRFGVHYPLRNNMRAEAGTVAFWVAPVNWNRNNKVFSHFFAVPARDAGKAAGPRPFDVLLYKFRDEDAVYAFGMGNELVTMDIGQVPMGESWKPGVWNFVAFSWDSQGATLYVNGQQDHRRYKKAAPAAFATETFHLGGPYFQENDSLTLMSDLRIYGRTLTDQEIQTLYLVGKGR